MASSSFYLPEELQRLINDFARPCTRPDWRKGGYLNRSMKRLHNRLVLRTYSLFDLDFLGDKYYTPKALQEYIERWESDFNDEYQPYNDFFGVEAAEHNMAVEIFKMEAVICDENGRRIFKKNTSTDSCLKLERSTA